MNILKNFLFGCLAIAATAFAEENTENICNELGNDVVHLKLAYVDEFRWYGDKDLVKADSQRVVRHESLNQLVPERNKFPYNIPYSVDAGCLVKKQVTYSYMQWNGGTKAWDLNDGNHDYATSILDIHGNRTEMFDSTNAYNLLIVRAHNASLDDDVYSPDELFVSKTYELAFESWFAIAVAKKEGTVVIDGTTYMTASYTMGYAIAQDSLKVVENARKTLEVPEGVEKIEVQVFHAVMKDPNRKLPVIESSSSVEPVVASSSSIAQTESSSSVAQVASSSGATPVVSSSSENIIESSSSTSPVESSNSITPAESSSSNTVVASSSSEGTLVLKSLQSVPALTGVRQVRRLDGSVVKSNEYLKPGVYYVQGMDGLWKKQLVKTR